MLFTSVISPYELARSQPTSGTHRTRCQIVFPGAMGRTFIADFNSLLLMATGDIRAGTGVLQRVPAGLWESLCRGGHGGGPYRSTGATVSATCQRPDNDFQGRPSGSRGSGRRWPRHHTGGERTEASSC